MQLILHTVPGLDRVLWKEVAGLDPAARNLGCLQAGERNSMLMVDTKQPEALLESRISEDVFALAGQMDNLQLSYKGLDQLARLASVAPGWDEALRLHAGITGGRGRRKISTYRVIARAQGNRAYKRSEAGEAVLRGLARRLGKRWKPVADNAQVEVWVTLVDTQAMIGVRLTSSHHRHRDKGAHIPASLRPSVAAALVFLTRPRPEDVFLDPFCGAGTILVERAVSERYKLLVGSDISHEHLRIAAENIQERYKPLELHNWNATSIPMEDGSVSAIATNPPFGKKLGSRDENRTLYPAFLAEARRLLRAGGRLVVVTSETGIMRRELDRPEWNLTDRYRLRILGQPATMFGATRT